MAQRLYRTGDADREIPLGVSDDYRSVYRRDLGRVVHSPAFRRLQGKTQLFPGDESDFFRSRLTHSIEVAQIAKSIALKLNTTERYFNRDGFRIDTDLVETAAFCHDIGHPPFGHNGEAALDSCMKGKGGFEGNAQTLRILAKLEKREKLDTSSAVGVTRGRNDGRKGLNLTYRTLASVIKYDDEIPFARRTDDMLQKGYYRSEALLVRRVKKAVTGRTGYRKRFKTIECQIMDIADDIAYSTYDLEDAFKGAFLTPMSLLGAGRDLLSNVAKKVSEGIGATYSSIDVQMCLNRIFGDLFAHEADLSDANGKSLFIAGAHRASERIVSDGYIRSTLTSELVGRFVSGVRLTKRNSDVAALSEISLQADILEEVEVLKNFVYQSLIMSPRLKVVEYRGREIVNEIFGALTDVDREGHRLLPDDIQSFYDEITGEQRDRVVCDFISGMTDRYAMEFYGRLKSENPETIFKPIY